MKDGKIMEFLKRCADLKDQDILLLNNSLVFLEKISRSFVDCEDFFVTGSYTKNTMVAPFKDLDCFLVLKDVFLKKEPEYSMSYTRELVSSSYEDIKCTVRAHALTITNANGTSIDVTPAVMYKGDYLIPELFPMTKPRWVVSNPKKHLRLLDEENYRLGGLTVPILRLLKYWRNIYCPYVKSFHLEVLLLTCIKGQSFSDMYSGLSVFFERAPRYTEVSCLHDGVNSANLVDRYLTLDERESFIEELNIGLLSIDKLINNL